MGAESYITNFPDGLPCPPLLVKLTQFYERTGGYLPGELELSTDGRQQVTGWFAGNEVAARPFVAFAIDNADSFFSYWRYEDQPLDRAPLVYLHFEDGSLNTVLTNTLEEFLVLLALGNPAYNIDMVEGKDEPETGDDVASYRMWLHDEVGVETPTIGEAHAIVERARTAHPDLSTWVGHRIEEMRNA